MTKVFKLSGFVGLVLIFLATVGCDMNVTQPAKPRVSTAQENVQVLAQSLRMPGLDRSRQIRLYLPPDYDIETDLYLAFITDVVKPYIDNHYRTKADINHTAIMGSSMGGLMSYYAIYSRPDVFSKAAIYSPSFWASEFADSVLWLFNKL